jgi:hypothetical protein
LQRFFKGIEIVFEKPVAINIESAIARASRSKPSDVDISVMLLLAAGNEDNYIISFLRNGSTVIEVHLACSANSLHRVRLVVYGALASGDRDALIISLSKFLKYIRVDPQILNTIL